MKVKIGLSVAAFLAVSMGVAEARSRFSCGALYKARRYAQAGLCYRRAARALKDRQRKGRMLRNAAHSYERAGRAAGPVARRSYYYELGARVMHRYIKGKLAENSYRHQSGVQMRKRLIGKVGYASLTILTGAKDARIELRGFRYLRRTKGRFRGWLRPGSYRVQVRFPGGTKTRELVLRPSRSLRLEVMLAPRPRPRPRPRPLKDVPDPLLGSPALPRRARSIPPRRIEPGARPGQAPAAKAQPQDQDILSQYDRLPSSPGARPPKLPRPAPQAGLPIGAFVTAGGGLVAVGVGIALVVASGQQYQGAKEHHQSFQSPSSAQLQDTQKIAADVRGAQATQALGWALVSIGGVAGVAGVIWLVASLR